MMLQVQRVHIHYIFGGRFTLVLLLVVFFFGFLKLYVTLYVFKLGSIVSCGFAENSNKSVQR